MIAELDRVVLTAGLSQHGLRNGVLGTVVLVHAEGAAYEIEPGQSAGGSEPPSLPSTQREMTDPLDPVSDLDAGTGASAEPLRHARETIHELLARNPSASMEEINAAVGARVMEYNRAPQPELGGLSPVQVRALIDDDWSGDGAVRLNAALSPGEVAPSRTLHNVRLLLESIAAQRTVHATAQGNLPRALVRDMIPHLRLPPNSRREYVGERLNEEDVFPAHLARILAELAGLVKRRRGAYSLTRRGTDLARKERSGELFALLFRVHFRDLNLAYLDRMAPTTGFQGTIACAVYRLGQVARAWKPIDEIAGAILLPAVRDELPWNQHHDVAGLLVGHRLLRPLEGFGLVEERPHPGNRVRFGERNVRLSPLWDRFLAFVLD